MWNRGLYAIYSINLYQAATVELIKALTYKETVVINRWENEIKIVLI